jgi:Cu2+-containing amine oxidase
LECEVVERCSTSTSKDNNSDKLSPLQAKELKRNVLMSKDRQINVKKRRGKATTKIRLEEGDKEFMIEQRKLKMKFDLDCHNDLKKQHMDMMNIKKQKLDLQKLEMNICMDNEKSKKTFSNIEIFKARLEFKQQDPTINNKFLDQYFSLDK